MDVELRPFRVACSLLTHYTICTDSFNCFVPAVAIPVLENLENLDNLGSL